MGSQQLRMGASTSLLEPQEVDAYKQLTFFTEPEIRKCLKRFQKMLPDEVSASISNKQISSINHPSCCVDVEVLRNELAELQVNPFSDQMCKIFTEGNTVMVFEQFLDMMSVMSVSAPVEVKAEWAFKLFDLDGDEYITQKDIGNVVERVSDLKEDDEHIEKVSLKVLKETDINDTGKISLTEFKQIVTKSPDFVDSFKIKL